MNTNLVEKTQNNYIINDQGQKVAQVETTPTPTESTFNIAPANFVDKSVNTFNSLSDVNKGIVIFGASLGGILLLTGITFLCIFCRKRSKRNRRREMEIGYPRIIPTSPTLR